MNAINPNRITTVLPFCLFLASVPVLPIIASFTYLYLVYSPRNRGGSGSSMIPDFSGVLPVFGIVILVPLGTILSIAAAYRREPYASLLLWFYGFAATSVLITFFVH